MSADLRLILAPRRVYAALARGPRLAGVSTAVRRPLLAVVVLGAATAITATGRLTPSLLVSTTICWSFVVLIQAAIALPLLAGPARRTVGIARAIDLYFAAQAPWNLWFLGLAAWSPWAATQSNTPMAVAACVPAILTPRIVAAFFRDVLELDPRDALLRTAVQQGVTWGLFVALFGLAVQLVPRVLEWLG